MKTTFTGSIPCTHAPVTPLHLTGSSVLMRNSGALSMSGNRFVNPSSQVVQLQGVVLSQIEKSCSDKGVFSTPSLFTAMAGWNINCVKFQVNPKFWIDGCPHATGDPNSAAYRTMVQNAVTAAQAANLYVIICPVDYYLPKGGNYPAPDQYTLWFWGGQSSSGIPGVAQIYASDQTVLFETFSEPHQITGTQFLSGGTVNWTDPSGNPGPTITAVGVQAELNTIAGAAPSSIVLIDHKDFDSTPGLEFTGYAPTGTYGWSAHIYNSGNNAIPAKWDANFGTLAQSLPMVACEFGDFNYCTGTYITELMQYMKANLAGWMAFTYDNNKLTFLRPSLLSPTDPNAYANATVSDYGAPIQAFYLAN